MSAKAFKGLDLLLFVSHIRFGLARMNIVKLNQNNTKAYERTQFHEMVSLYGETSSSTSRCETSWMGRPSFGHPIHSLHNCDCIWCSPNSCNRNEQHIVSNVRSKCCDRNNLVYCNNSIRNSCRIFGHVVQFCGHNNIACNNCCRNRSPLLLLYFVSGLYCLQKETEIEELQHLEEVYNRFKPN